MSDFISRCIRISENILDNDKDLAKDLSVVRNWIQDATSTSMDADFEEFLFRHGIPSIVKVKNYVLFSHTVFAV